MKSQRSEIKCAFNQIPFALIALLLFYSREVKIRMKCNEETIFPSFGEEWTGRLWKSWNGTWSLKRSLCICIDVFQSVWSIRQKERKGGVRCIYIYALANHKSDNSRLLLVKSYLSEIDAASLHDHPLIKSRTTIVSLAWKGSERPMQTLY